MKKQATYYHDISEAEERELAKLEADLPVWQETKIVTDKTPFLFLTQTISTHLAEKGQGKQNLIYAVKMFQTDRPKFIELLEEAGCTVESLADD